MLTFVELDIVEPTKPHFIEPIDILPEDFDGTAEIII